MRRLSLQDLAFYTVITAVIIYVILRAALINITHDEAFSFYNMKHVWYAQVLCTGNTHWLNSLAIKLALVFGGESPLSIRWLSVLACATFCCVIIFWLQSIRTFSLKLLALSLALFHPYFIDYFSLARGYAAGIAFESLSILLFISVIRYNKSQFKTLSLLCAALSSFANFGFIYFTVAFAFIYFYTFYWTQLKTNLRKKAIYLEGAIIAITLGIVALAFRFIMRCSGDVVGAGEESFAELFNVFIDGGIYYKLPISSGTLGILSQIFAAFVIASIINGLFFKHKIQNPSYYYSAYLLGIILLLTILNNVAFNVVFPFYRTALFLFPLIALNLFYGFDALFKAKLLKNSLAIGISTGLAVNFILSVNLKYTFDFKEQSDCKASFLFLKILNAKQVGISPELYGAFRNYYSTITQLNNSYYGEQIETREPKGSCAIKNKLQEFDYLLLFPPYNLTYYPNSQVKLKAMYLSPTTKNLIVKIIK